ncbi:glycogen debranching protein GlgX [Thorsellia anophelis]|uniref:Glycogen operon protein n=1 Tax=Thorsellia anophelis DSM 18579 TaxID=1123402 RepID=A0A1I0CNF6_9GAMM|nr:glycogen debranching protein GlgX [Thorsellia anophelis]SET21021.1 glycogen operon protein [Thorsellia anophelis DSM 18579]
MTIGSKYLLTEGSPVKLGATVDKNGINFAIYSASAEHIELCFFDDNECEIRLAMPGKTGNIWHGYLSLDSCKLAKPGLRYGYRAFGPFNPARGERFNSQKLLLDPYSLKIDSTPKNHTSHYGGNAKPNHYNSAPYMAKSIVSAPLNYQFKAPKPNHPWHKTVIYEAHAKGLTKMHPDIPEAIRGSYAGLVHPVMLEHYQSLGISAIELLPIAHHSDEPRLQSIGLSNYWGYNSIAHSALEPSYASGFQGMSPEEEFCYAVDKLHESGIEVILDVVYNHTAELDADGPTFSFRGLDNQNAYWLLDNGDYDNMTGCGNATNLQHEGMLNYVLHSLRHWILEYGVDGFRFDLATLLGRTPAFDKNARLLVAMINDPVISKVKLISEPWDVGLGGYQVGQFPDPFADWNDKYRDTIRQFWLYHPITLGDFAQAFAGSRQLFASRESPFASINFITAHDGFTLEDCVAYNNKHNFANGEENRDGTNNNFSNNHGAEGITNDDTILANRAITKQSLLFTLLLSQGTPMILAGDEIHNSQSGNNNAYCLDNETSWLDWSSSTSSLSAWIKKLITIRHQIPALTENQWWQDGKNQVNWLNADATSLSLDEWQSTTYPILQIKLSEKWLLIFNRSHQAQNLILPKGKWQFVISSDELFNMSSFNMQTVTIERGVYLFKQ